MIACIFAGQGSQSVGMGQQLAASSAAARNIYADAAEVAGIDLLNLDESQLSQTRFAQLAIVTLSLAAFAAFREAGIPGQDMAFAGFSLGEYSALSAAGVLDTPAVLRLVEERSRLMQLAAEANPGAMYAILGLDDAKIEAILAQPEFAGLVYPVNYNCPGQLVIAGAEAETAAAAAAIKAAGAKRALKLNVNGAFHTRFMSDAAPGLAALPKHSISASLRERYTPIAPAKLFRPESTGRIIWLITSATPSSGRAKSRPWLRPEQPPLLNSARVRSCPVWSRRSCPARRWPMSKIRILSLPPWPSLWPDATRLQPPDASQTPPSETFANTIQSRTIPPGFCYNGDYLRRYLACTIHVSTLWPA